MARLFNGHLTQTLNPAGCRHNAVPDPEPVPTDLLAGQYGEGGEEDHGARATKGCSIRMRQDQGRHARYSRLRYVLISFLVRKFVTRAHGIRIYLYIYIVKI